MALGHNVIANIIGQGVRAVVGILLVPVYVSYLGIESYGLIGIFGVLQAWLVLLDFGMRPALTREMARFTGGAHTVEWIRDLLRTVEVIGMTISAAVALGTWAASSWLAVHWVTTSTLDSSTVAGAFALMGVVTALRFVENIYTSCLVGLQRQVLESIVSSVVAVVRGVGAIVVLASSTPSIGTFFLWQCLVSIGTVAIMAVLVYQLLPASPRVARFSQASLKGIRSFASGMLVLTVQSLIITNMDKVLLTKLLSLKDFGAYALAGVAANALSMLALPVASALSPRFTELATRHAEADLARVYQLGSQGVAVLCGAAAAVLMAFSDRFLLLWTKNPQMAFSLAPILSLLVGGSLINVLGYIPYHLQLAHGWTRLAVVYNSVVIVATVPALLFLVPRYGVYGAASVWAVVNAAYVVVNLPLMHQRLLRGELWRWYRNAAIPICVAEAVAWGLSMGVPRFESRGAEFVVIVCVSVVTIVAAALGSPAARARFGELVQSRRRVAP